MPPPDAVTGTGLGRPRFGYGGDFGPAGTPSDETFCINGLVQPGVRPLMNKTIRRD